MSFLKKLFSFSIGTLSSVLIGIISLPILTRIIDPEEFGIATIFITIATLLSILGLLGADQALVRFFYEKDKISLLLKSLFISLIGILVISTIVTVFDKSISNYINADESYSVLLIIYLISLVIFRFSNVILRMLEYGYRYSLILTLQKILEFVFILSFALLITNSHLAIIFGNILAMLILTLVSLLLSREFWKRDSKISEKIELKKILFFSYPLMISILMTTLFQSFDKLFLNYYGSSQDLGVYTAGFKLIAILNLIQTTFNLVWTSASLKQYNNDPHDRLFYTNVTNIVSLVMLTLGVTVILLKDVLVLFLGVQFREASIVIPALVLMPIMYAMSETTVIGVNFKLKTHLHLVISGIALLINVVGSFILVPIYGMQGAALAVGLAYVSFYFTRTYFGLKCYSFKIKLKEVTLIIFIMILWIIAVMFLDNHFYLIVGATILYSYIFFVFRKEIKDNFKLINLYLKTKSVKKNNGR